MNLIQKLMERLRTLVGLKGWDYCVLWILSDDQRYIAWMDCCCGGSDNSEINGGDQIQFPVSTCRDAMFQHQRTKSCELLTHLPSSMPLDSGIHAQTLLSNQPRWFNFSNTPDLSVIEGTRALIPVPGGLIELFVAKQVSEDQQIIDYVTSQCSILMEQEAIINSSNMDANFAVYNHDQNEDNNNKSNEFQQAPISPAVAALENLNLSHDISASSMNFLQQFNYSDEHLAKNNDHDHVFFEGNKEKQENEGIESIKQENGKSDYISDCSDQIDEENDGNGNNNNNNNNNNRRRNNGGRGGGAKNLHAERKRRKRLNGRLYDLRALVPKITSLNKAAILGDAIDYVNELKQLEKELEAELQDNSDAEDCENGNMAPVPDPNLNNILLNQDQGFINNVASSEVASFSKLIPKPHHHHHHHHHDKAQQMEVQVEVAQINGNEFYVNVFCEHKAGGFVRIMEALESLGLEVKNVNVTSCLGLVSNIFKVEKKENEMVQADYVREYLLELTRDPPKGWHENGNGINIHQHLHVKPNFSIDHHI